jgi:serine/threonine protein kinase
VRGREHSCKSTEPLKMNQTNELKGEARYQQDKKVGSGTFGTVFKARDKKTLDVVAIKKVFQDKNYKNRELDILRILNHPNVLSMKDSFFTY